MTVHAREGELAPVSIVLATHNRPGWLRLAIDSVLDQDYAISSCS